MSQVSHEKHGLEREPDWMGLLEARQLACEVKSFNYGTLDAVDNDRMARIIGLITLYVDGQVTAAKRQERAA